MARSTMLGVAFGVVVGVAATLLVWWRWPEGESAALEELFCTQVDSVAIADWTPGGVDVIVFLGPTVSAANLEAVRAQVETDGRVVRSTYLDQPGAYEEFRRLFADKPDLIRSVTAETLPSSFRLEVDDDETIPAIASSFEGRPGVFEVRTASETTRALRERCTRLAPVSPSAFRSDVETLVSRWSDTTAEAAIARADAYARILTRCAGD